MNTDGGHLCHAYIPGMTHVLEGVRQMRGARGEAQVLQVMRYLRDEESLAPREAIASAATLVVDRLCLLDDLGLPDHDQRESAIQKIEEIARRLR